MPGITALRRQPGYLMAAGLALGLLLPTADATAGITAVETLPGPHALIENVRVTAGETDWEVRGTVRLLPAPLLHSTVGRIVVEGVARGRTVARNEAVVYRVVTADRRSRLFGFRARLRKDVPAEVHLRIYRLLPAK